MVKSCEKKIQKFIAPFNKNKFLFAVTHLKQKFLVQSLFPIALSASSLAFYVDKKWKTGGSENERSVSRGASDQVCSVFTLEGSEQ